MVDINLFFIILKIELEKTMNTVNLNYNLRK